VNLQSLTPEKLAELRDSVDTERCRRSLAHFARRAWPIVEPAMPLADGWHLDAICEHLEAVSRDQIDRLLINIPPGHAKSLLVSVLWPAWTSRARASSAPCASTWWSSAA
jgi:hypothetical protein